MGFLRKIAKSVVSNLGGGRFYSDEPGRWRFCDGFVDGEFEDRERIMNAIESFWSSLEEHGPALLSAIRGAEPTYFQFWADEHLEPIDPKLGWELGPAKGKFGEFCLSISAEGNPELKPIIETLVFGAPAVAGLTLQAGRPGVVLEWLPEMFRTRSRSEGLQRELPMIGFNLKTNRYNLIDLECFSPDFEGGDDEDDYSDCLLVCNLILGEEEVERWVGNISTRVAMEEEHVPGAVSMGVNLATEFAECKARIVAGMPELPWYLLERRDEFYLVEVKDGKQRIPKRKTMGAIDRDLGLSLLYREPFYSESFSRNREKFCYLVFDESAPSLGNEDIKSVSRFIDPFLREAAIGCLVGLGAGKTSGFYLDLCLVDVDRAIPVLRKFASEHKLPRESYLRFYDADWCYEWVGMYPDSPVPEEFQ